MELFDRLKQMLISQRQFSKNDSLEPIGTGSTYNGPVHREQSSDQELSRQKRVTLLTPREYDLYLLLLEGYTLKECAKKLSVKYSTANTHMTGVYKKLGVKTRAELIIHYRGIVNMESIDRNSN